MDLDMLYNCGKMTVPDDYIISLKETCQANGIKPGTRINVALFDVDSELKHSGKTVVQDDYTISVEGVCHERGIKAGTKVNVNFFEIKEE